jgi:Domain of unknown function (DUF4815)
MPLDKQTTTLREAPYYDDYDEAAGYYRVLFKPSVAVQTRELTQLQTILQNQIERFGENIYRTGTVIKGCSLVGDSSYYYVKLFDTAVDGSQYDLAGVINAYAVDTTSNLTALTVNYSSGGQATNPDLQTLYIKYLNTGTGGEKLFSNSAVLTIYDRNYHVESIEIVDGGSAYSNNDIVRFTGGGGTGAVATVTTYANGTVRTINILEPGIGYTTAPTVAVANSTGGTANGTGASLIAYNYKTQLKVANSFYTNPVGKGYALKVSEGVIFQKGHFVRVEAQDAIVSKYTNTPNNVVVGFVTTESVVNSSSNSALLDNANTINNSAPGADRLKLTANLAVLTPDQAASNVEFLSLYEFQNGKIVKDRTNIQFNSIAKELSKRTFEESGNYVVDPIPLYTESISGNTTHLNLVVGAGLGYIQGNRVQLFNNARIPIQKATTTHVDETQSVSTSYGGFVYVNETLGRFDVKYGSQVTLRSAAATDVSDNAGGSPSAPGVQIGTARIRSMVFDSGTPGTPSAVYRMYLFDVQMSSGNSFKDVRAIASSGNAVADIVLNPVYNYATVEDVQFDSLLFTTGTYAVQEFGDEEFIFRTQTDATFPVSGNVSISFSGGNTLPYTPSSTLSSTQKRDFIVVPQTTITSSTNRTGTVAISSGTSNVTGTSSLFTTQYQVGQYIKVGTQDPKRITAIYSNTVLQVSNNYTATATAQTHTVSFPANVPINFQDDASKSITIDATGTTLTLNLGTGITSTGTATIYHDMKNESPSVKVKTVKNPVYVKLSTDSFTDSTTGPWCLGVPDALELVGVYVGGSNTYSESGTNYKDSFVLDKGQTDNFYGLSYLAKKPGSSLSLTSSSCLLVKFKALTHGSGKYISTESYSSIIDDSSTTLPDNKIRTQDIPVYVSPRTGKAFDLRDVLDFRPIVEATANVNASSASSATVDPSSTISFSGVAEAFFPSPTREFQASITSYLSRIDRVVIDTYGDVRVVEGIPSNSPSIPSEPQGTMTLGAINVSPYPSLSAKEAADSKRPDLGVYVSPTQTKRYTMRDIGDIEKRINRLEYYALLNTLEQNTKDLVIQSESNSAIERFKNGFFVDPLTDYNVSNLNDPEYKILIDTTSGIARPNLADTKIDLQFTTTGSTNVEKTGDLVHLAYDNKQIVNQPFANKYRNLVESFWRYKGNVQVIPSYDNYYDMTSSAVSIAIDLASPVQALASATSEALSQLNVSTSIDRVANIGNPFLVQTTGTAQVFAQNIERTLTDTRQKIVPGQENITYQEVGNFVTDFSLKPYIREQKIGVYASGLRPGARHYAFFDGVNISAAATPASLTTFGGNTSPDSFVPTGVLGANLVANSTGEVAALINIPANTYFTGERSVIIIDVDNLSSESSASSKADGNFVAYSFGVNKTAVSVATKSIETYTVQNFTNTYTVSDRITFERALPPQTGGDPISQTFKVQAQSGQTDGVYIDSVDLYFKRKDASGGVTCEVRETVNGVPSSIVVPFSRKHLQSADVSVSDDATSATRFTFNSPIYLRTETEYAVVVYPDGNSPEYLIWSAQAGTPDVANTSLISNQNWGLGTLFFSTSGTSWTPVQDEDLKFAVNRAEFTSLSGTAVFENQDYEFLTVNTQIGTFKGGERVAHIGNTYLQGTFTTTTNSYVIATSNSQVGSLANGDYLTLAYGTAQLLSTGNVDATGLSITPGGSQTTAFTSEYSNGDFIRIGNDIRQVVSVTNSSFMTIDAALTSAASNAAHYRIDEKFDVLRVTGANSTTITVAGLPSYNSNSTLIVNGMENVTGIVDQHDTANNKLIITKSTSANDNFKIVAGDSTYYSTIVGTESQAQARVESVDDVNVNIFKPLINTLIVPGTGISMTGIWTTNSGSTSTSSYQLDKTNRIPFNQDALVKSKSNEISGTTLTKSLKVSLALSTGSVDVTPIVDINPSSIVVSRNIINNSDTGETTRYGENQAKYVSKRMTLADGLDAEDARVFMTAYKPTGTNIKVYGKVLNALDGETFEDKDWTELTQLTSATLYSDSLNPEDYREYEFTFPNTPPATAIGGVATTYSNTTVTGSDTTFTSDLVAGDLIKLVKSNRETDYDLIPVASVANNTSLTLQSSVSFTDAGVIIEKVTQPKAAFKYTRNDYIVRYHDSTNAAFDSYKYLAIKVILMSPYNYLVPTINDIRALAISV